MGRRGVLLVALAVSHFFVGPSELFAANNGKIHKSGRLTRGDARFFVGNTMVKSPALWCLADRVEACVQAPSGGITWV